MSLLMKALEKAAKDRAETDGPRAPAASADAGASGPLTLEPMAQPAAASAAPGVSAAPREPVLAPRKSTATTSTGARDSAQAATVMRAGQRDTGGGIGAYVRENPLLVFGVLTTLFLLAYGSYVYLQMTNPGMFSRQQPRPAPITPPAAPAAVPAPGVGSVATAQQPLATTLLLPTSPTENSGKERPAPATPAPAAPASSGTGAQLPAAPAAPAAPAPRDTIKVTHGGGAAPTLNPLLAGAYQALDSGNLELSRQLYNRLLQREPDNVDALLGLAAIAAQNNDRETATRHYMKLLDLDPRNTLAQAGLIGLLGRADPLAAETRVKQLIGRDPSAYLYFTLGNVYVDQNRWPDAQQAYFQAHHLQPDNPDYAYNLAVGLEHVGQPKLALSFYRHAAQLAAAKGRANFDTAAAEERISKLAKVVE